MNFERISIQTNKPEVQEKITSSIEGARDKERIRVESHSIPELEKEMEYVRIEAEELLSNFLAYFEIDIDVAAELKDVPIRVVAEENQDVVGGYFYPTDIVAFNTNIESKSEIEKLLWVIHELWHSLAGIKDYYVIQGSEDTNPRRLLSIGFSKEILETSNEDGDVFLQRLRKLDGFNEGVTEFLTQQVALQKYEELYSSYPFQARVIQFLMQGIATREGVHPSDVISKLLSSYMRQDLYFLKQVKRHYGHEGVHILKLMDDDYDSPDMRTKHELMCKFFNQTDPQVRHSLFEDICKLDKQIAERRSIEEDTTYISEPFNPPLTTNQLPKSQDD